MPAAALTRGIHATADLHYGVLSRSWMPLLSIRLPAALDDEAPVSELLLWRLRGQGWGSPAALLRGGDLDCLARASIDGAAGDGPLTVAYDGQVLFHGPVERSDRWVAAAQATGGVPVLLSTLDAPDDVTELARDGLVAAAWARLFHRGHGVASPVL